MTIGVPVSVTLENGSTVLFSEVPRDSLLEKALYAWLNHEDARYFLMKQEFIEYVKTIDPGGEYTRPDIEYTIYKTRAARIQRKDLVKIAEIAMEFGLFWDVEFVPSNYKLTPYDASPFKDKAFLEPEVFQAWCNAVTEN